MPSLSYDALVQLSQACGLTLAGVLGLEEANFALRQEKERREAWLSRGYAGEMNYMARRLEDVRLLLPSATTVACFLVPYFSNNPEAAAANALTPVGFGRVSRYAWGRDYHRIISKRLKQLSARVAELKGCAQALECRAFVDSVPISERSLALATGKGFAGKNMLFISPGIGSFSFLAELVWNVSVPDCNAKASLDQTPGKCGSCTRCLCACPTKALIDGQMLDASCCLAYLTVEKKAELNEWERRALGSWVFGCDLCQQVCPFNHRGIQPSLIKELGAESGVGPLLHLPSILELRSEEQFLSRFRATALMRAGREGLLRNACYVLANTKCYSSLGILKKVAQEDSSQIIQEAADWAVRELE